MLVPSVPYADAVSQPEWCPNVTMNINLIGEIGESKMKELDTCSATLLLIMAAFAGDWGAYESVKSTAVLEKMILNYQNKREQSNMESILKLLKITRVSR